MAGSTRRRYSDADILAELRACAARIGRSPTMRELATDPLARVHPQTAVQRFGSWNVAKRRAGLAPRRFATRADHIERLQALGRELGRPPTGRDLGTRKGAVPSTSLLWQTFGSLRAALREAGFDVPSREERVERAVQHGVRLAHRLRRLPSFADWARERGRDARLPSEWQIYRLAGGGRGAWVRFQQLVRARLAADGRAVLTGPSRARPARRAARGRSGPPRGRARREGSAR
jgi:hypothetical protein